MKSSLATNKLQKFGQPAYPFTDWPGISLTTSHNHSYMFKLTIDNRQWKVLHLEKKATEKTKQKWFPLHQVLMKNESSTCGKISSTLKVYKTKPKHQSMYTCRVYDAALLHFCCFNSMSVINVYPAFLIRVLKVISSSNPLSASNWQLFHLKQMQRALFATKNVTAHSNQAARLHNTNAVQL